MTAHNAERHHNSLAYVMVCKRKIACNLGRALHSACRQSVGGAVGLLSLSSSWASVTNFFAIICTFP